MAPGGGLCICSSFRGVFSVPQAAMGWGWQRFCPYPLQGRKPTQGCWAGSPVSTAHGTSPPPRGLSAHRAVSQTAGQGACWKQHRGSRGADPLGAGTFSGRRFGAELGASIMSSCVATAETVGTLGRCPGVSTSAHDSRHLGLQDGTLLSSRVCSGDQLDEATLQQGGR